MEIPDGFDDLFADDVLAFLVLGTSSGDDRVALAPIWFLSDDRGLIFSSEEETVKVRNIRRQPEVAATLLAEGEHARYVSIRGRVDELTSDTDDVVDLYRRLVARYQTEPLQDPAPANMVYFRLVPQRMQGYDFRGYLL